MAMANPLSGRGSAGRCRVSFTLGNAPPAESCFNWPIIKGRRYNAEGAESVEPDVIAPRVIPELRVNMSVWDGLIPAPNGPGMVK